MEGDKVPQGFVLCPLLPKYKLYDVIHWHGFSYPVMLFTLHYSC